MNPRERALAVLLVCIIILVGGSVLGYQFFYKPWDSSRKTLKRLKQDAETKQLQLVKAQEEQRQLDLYRNLSLPSDLDLANRKYAKLLGDLFTKHGVPRTKCTIDPSRSNNVETGNTRTKGPQVFTRLTFNVSAYANLKTLVAVMEDFHHIGLLHEIKSFKFQRQTTGPVRDELHATFTIEALIVDKGGQRSWVWPNINPGYLAIDLACNLQRAPGGLAMAVWAAGPTGTLGPGVLATNPARDYKAIGDKNIFFGRTRIPKSTSPQEVVTIPAENVVPKWTKIELLVNNGSRWEARIKDWATDKVQKIQSRLGYDLFTLLYDDQGRPVVQGKVVQWEQKDIRYRVGVALQDGTDNDGFYSLSKKDRSDLVAEKLITATDENRLCWVSEAYWNRLIKLRVLQWDDSEDRFTIEIERDQEKPSQNSQSCSRLVLLRGQILKHVENYLAVRLEERYYNLQVNRTLEESFKDPFSEKKVKELKLAAQEE